MKNSLLSIPLVVAIIAAIASAGDRAPLVVNSGRVQQTGSGDTLVADQVRTSMVQAGTLATDGLRFNNWSPTGLGTKATFQIQPGDNTGNWVTGIDAIGASIPLGARITVCNANGPQDAGVVQFIPESSSSLANNRIWIPGYGRNTAQTTYNAFALGPSSCIDLVYMQPDQADVTTKRWLFVGGDSRKSLLVVKQLGLYPYSFTAAITSGTTVNDYDALDTCPNSGFAGGIQDGRCEAGSDPHQTSYTLVNLSTTGAGSVTITGLKYSTSGSQAAEGQGPVKVLCNYGPGDIKLTNTDAGSTSLDEFGINPQAGNQADIVMRQGQCTTWNHIRDVGHWLPITHQDYLFDARDVSMTKGLLVSGVSASAGVANTTFMIDQIATGRASNAINQYIRDVGSYNTTSAGFEADGLIISQSATRNAGANNLTNGALVLVAANGQSNYALQTQGGNIYMGLGAQMSFAYLNSLVFDVSAAANVETTLYVGGGAFTGTARQAIAQASVAPTANHGTLDASSSNFVGRVTAVGAFTSVTVTFAGGFGTTAFCQAQIEGSAEGIYVTPSPTAPTFNCFNTSTLAAANCNNFAYNCWGH